MTPPKINSASVRVMRSHDYSHFEIVLGTNGDDLTPDDVDELRKTAARLADKAVAQYRIAKVNASRLLSEKYERAALVDRIKRIRDTPEGDRTVNAQAELKAFDDASWEASHNYDYEDDWQDDEDN